MSRHIEPMDADSPDDHEHALCEIEARQLCDRLGKVMRHVAANTRDSWARDYLVKRLGHFGLPASLSNPVRTEEETRAWASLAYSMRPYTELMFVTLLAVEAGELSEGRAVEMLKVDCITLRKIRHNLITSLVAFAGECKSPLISLLDILKGKPDSSETSTEDQPSSNSSGKDG